MRAAPARIFLLEILNWCKVYDLSTKNFLKAQAVNAA